MNRAAARLLFADGQVERLIQSALQPWRQDRDWEDLQQEARVRCWIVLGKPAGGGVVPSTLVWYSARYAVIDYLRRRNRFPMVSFPDAEEEGGGPVVWFDEDGALTRTQCERAWRLMHDRERQVAWLHYFEGHSFREVGALMGINGKRAYTILQTGLDRGRRFWNLPVRDLNQQSRYRTAMKRAKG